MARRPERGFDGTFEVFDPTAEGVLAWVRTTRPTPPREDVAAHVAWLSERGLLADHDLRRLAAAGYAVAER
jgi:hypothetical protein